MSNPLSALDMLSTIALMSEHSNLSSNNVSGFCTPRDNEEHDSENHYNVTRQFRSPSMHAKELNEHDFHRALGNPAVIHPADHPSHQLHHHRVKRDHDGNQVSVATGHLLVPPGTPVINSAVTTPLRPIFHKQGTLIS